MTTRILVWSLFFAVLFLAQATPASAQRPVGGRYLSPSGPTITPYLDYFRRDNGALDPYHNFVRPKAQLRQVQQQMNSQLQQERARTNQLGQELNKMRESGAGATGAGSSYMNYMHYYNMSNSGASGRVGR